MILSLSKDSSKLIFSHASWMHRNGSKISIWEDLILGKNKLSSYSESNGLKHWMCDNQLLFLFDTSEWDAKGTWTHWTTLPLFEHLMIRWNI